MVTNLNDNLKCTLNEANVAKRSLSRVCAPTLPLTNNTGSRVSLKRGPLPGWPAWTREQMIRGSAVEREEREVEAERDKFKSTRPASDKLERAPSGALSAEIERVWESRSPFKENKANEYFFFLT